MAAAMSISLTTAFSLESDFDYARLVGTTP